MKLRILFLVLLSFNALFAETISHEKSDGYKKVEVKCRCVCDKRVSNEERIQEIIDYYKNSKYYTFTK